MKLPAGACDCHFHVFGPSGIYPYAPDRDYTPDDAPVEAISALHAGFGISRGVIVQPSVYGTDNRATEAALARLGPGYRGIAVVAPSISDEELARLDKCGFRGIRFNLLFAGGASRDDLAALARRIAPLGWHIQILCDIDRTPDLLEIAAGLPVPVVFDHMGHPGSRPDPEGQNFIRLASLLETGSAWVKLSGAYRISRTAEPACPDVTPVARWLAERTPHRCVWGTDWPHPGISRPAPAPDDLFSQVFDWMPDRDTRQRVLVDNAALLYGF